jgi:hypothetical protein
LPQKSLASQREAAAVGLKMGKERVTILVAGFEPSISPYILHVWKLKTLYKKQSPASFIVG